MLLFSSRLVPSKVMFLIIHSNILCCWTLFRPPRRIFPKSITPHHFNRIFNSTRRVETMDIFLYFWTESPKDQSPTQEATYIKEVQKLPSNPKEVEDLRRDSATNPLTAFTYDELKNITGNFRLDKVIGGGGFGSVYKGFIKEELGSQKVPQPLPVAVKVHDGDNSYQGHREWLVSSLSVFCLYPKFQIMDRDYYLLCWCCVGRGDILGTAFTSELGEVGRLLLWG